MKKNILKIKGVLELKKHEQLHINGGGGIRCSYTGSLCFQKASFCIEPYCQGLWGGGPNLG